MLATLTQYGEQTALILDQQLLTRLQIDINTLLDIEIEGQSLIMTPVQDERRRQQFEAALTQANRKYGNMLQRLADNTICKTKE